MNKNRIKQLLHENDLVNYSVDGASPETNEYKLGTNELFESDLLKRVTESGIEHYKALKRKKS